MKANYKLYLIFYYIAFFTLCLCGAFVDSIVIIKCVMAMCLVLLVTSSMCVENIYHAKLNEL